MKKYLVIGNPIQHSLSPKLHNYWISKNNIAAFYDKKKLDISELKNLIEEVREKKIDGINVTVPFKNSVIPLLDKLSSEAEKTQSVNTIYLKDENVIGHNTDIEGFELAIKHINYEISDKKVLLLGAGGVSPSIIVALNKMNAKKILISNRTQSKAEILKKGLEENEKRGLFMGSAFRLGTELVAAVVVGTIIGFILDNWFDTKPWFIIIFFFIGVIAGILNVIRVAKNMQKKD